MGPVGLHAVNDQLLPVEAVILLRVPPEKAGAENGLRRVFPLLVVQSVHAAKVGNSRFRADARSAKKHGLLSASKQTVFFIPYPALPAPPGQGRCNFPG